MDDTSPMGPRARVDIGFVLATVLPTLLPLWFAAHAILIVYNYAIVGGVVGVDAEVYLDAARRVLSGGDPWAATPGSFSFAGPPPTLLFYLPLALLPDQVGVAVVVLAGAAAAVWSVRALALPPWWLLFPPLFEGVLVGNPDPIVLALLLTSGRVAGVAVGLKVYAAIPLLLQRRWAPLAVGVAVVALSAPLWPPFLAQLPAIRTTLDEQSAGYSAWGTWLMPVVIVALWSLRRLGASWLVVPAVWPDTQIHYSAMSLPAIHRFPIAAAIIGMASPFSAPIAILVMAAQARWWPSSIRADRTP